MPYKEQTLEFVPLAQKLADFMKPKHAHITATVQRNRVQDVGHRTAGSFAGKTVLQVTYTPPELL
jgi:hypothetical protein